MSAIIKDNKLIITIPNSEASLRAQHHGIKDRTVGMYYMSDIPDEISTFLNLESMNLCMYIDFIKSYSNALGLYEKLYSKNLHQAYKDNLITMNTSLETVKRLIKNNIDLWKINNPILTDTKKYLKLDASDNYIQCLRDFCLGDLTELIFEKLSSDCFRIYVKAVDDLEEKISDGIIANWCSLEE